MQIHPRRQPESVLGDPAATRRNAWFLPTPSSSTSENWNEGQTVNVNDPDTITDPTGPGFKSATELIPSVNTSGLVFLLFCLTGAAVLSAGRKRA